MGRSRYRVPDVRLIAQGRETAVELAALPVGHVHDLYARVGVDARALGRRIAEATRELLDAVVAADVAAATLWAWHREGERLALRARRWERWLNGVVREAVWDGAVLSFRFDTRSRPTVPGMRVRVDRLTADVELQRDALLQRAPATLLDRGTALSAELRALEGCLQGLTLAAERATAARLAARARFDAALAAHDSAVHQVRHLFGTDPPGAGRSYVPVPDRPRRNRTVPTRAAG